MAVTIRDLAERLNLSKSTVSYALNGGPKPVSEEVRRRVEEAALAMGYRPNEIARSLAVGRTHTIGFIPSSVRQRTLRSWFERTALEAICVAADERGLHLLLPSVNSPGGAAMADPHFATRLDGVVLLAPPDSSGLPDYLHGHGVPIATVAGSGQTVGPCFNADNAAGAEAAADHLYELGHRKIAVVAHRDHIDTAHRTNAFLQRINRLGLDVSDYLVETMDLTIEGGYTAARWLMNRQNRPTAVFCINDPTAVGFMRVAQELGFSVPGDLSVVGFDNDEIGLTFSPSLTTVHQPVAEMAVAAFDAVVDQIAGRPANSRTFPTPLIVRASTRPVEDISRNG